MQTDSSLSLQTKLKDHVPAGEIEIETKRKALVVSLSKFFEVLLFSEDLSIIVDEQFFQQLIVHGFV